MAWPDMRILLVISARSPRMDRPSLTAAFKNLNLLKQQMSPHIISATSFLRQIMYRGLSVGRFVARSLD